MSESTVIRNYQTVEVPPQGGAKCYDDDGRLKRTGNIWTASAHIITAVIGSGVLSLAWAIAQLGWIAGPVMMFLFSFVIYYTSCLLAECYRTGDPVTGKRNYTYMEAVRSNLGGIKFKVCGLVQYLNLFGIAIGYTIAASISMIWESATIFSLVLGSICYFGSQRFIGAVNGILIFGILSSFASLVGFASGNLQWDSLLKANFEAVPKSIPIIALSFVYQNVVPVLCTDLEGSLPKVRTAITVGTAIPLVLFLVWDAVILGNIPNIDTIADKIVDPIQQLKSINGSVGSIVEVFSFFAIATTYIGFVLGLTDFLADLLKLPNGQSKPLPYHVS